MYHDYDITFKILIENKGLKCIYDSYYIRTTIIIIYFPPQIYQIIISILIPIFIIMRIIMKSFVVSSYKT